MRFPSLASLMARASGAARRFPLVLLCALTSAAAGWWLIAADGTGGQESAERLLYAATLGIPALLAARLVAARRWARRPWRAVPDLAALGLVAAVYVLRPGWADPIAATRYVQLAAGLHLLVAVGPWLGPGERNGFWQHNRLLLLRFLTGALFAAVLFAGLAVALAALDNLFGVDVPGEAYARLWFAAAFGFHPWYVLAGVPDDLEALDRETDYPLLLKVLGQYVLAPIVALYLLILTAYLAKVLVSRVWPSGWIGWLVSGVAVAGLLGLLLLQPLGEREGARWVRAWSKAFHAGLLPAVAMLLMAAGQRIDQYGITENRYFLVVLALWLGAISVWFLVRRRPSNKVIPASLAAIAFLAFAGPWGAYAVSERSQEARLLELLAAQGMLDGGAARPPAGPVPFEARREISAVTRYLVETGRPTALAALLGDRMPPAETPGEPAGDGPARRVADHGTGDRASDIVRALGVEYVDRWSIHGPEDGFALFAAAGDVGHSVAGFDRMFRHRSAFPDTLRVEGRLLELALDSAAAALVVREEGEVLVEVPLAASIRRGIARERERGAGAPLPADVMRSEAESAVIRIAVIPLHAAGRFEGGEPGAAPEPAGSAPDGAPALTALSADILVRLAPREP